MLLGSIEQIMLKCIDALANKADQRHLRAISIQVRNGREYICKNVEIIMKYAMR